MTLSLQSLPRPNPRSAEPEVLAREIVDRLAYRVGKDPKVAKPHDWLQAVILITRDRAIEYWMHATRETYLEGEKRVYYLSLEFLIGRLMRDAVSNLGLDQLPGPPGIQGFGDADVRAMHPFDTARLLQVWRADWCTACTSGRGEPVWMTTGSAAPSNTGSRNRGLAATCQNLPAVRRSPACRRPSSTASARGCGGSGRRFAAHDVPVAALVVDEDVGLAVRRDREAVVAGTVLLVASLLRNTGCGDLVQDFGSSRSAFAEAVSRPRQ